MIIDSYPVKKSGFNKYIFTTKFNVEYEISLKSSGITYLDKNKEVKNILEVILKCETNISSKDYLTLNTLIKFCSYLMNNHLEAIFIQNQNEIESLKNGRLKRRGLLRVKLWEKLINTHSKDYIFLTNRMLNTDIEKDILSILIRKDSLYYKQIVTNFFRCRYI